MLYQRIVGTVAAGEFYGGFEGQDDEPYTGTQYERLAEVIHCLVDAFPGLSAERIAGHCDIAPQRKTDPGPAFDWARLKQQLDVVAS